MKSGFVTVIVAAAMILLVGTPITGGPDKSSRKSFKADLDGYQAVPFAILTDATGEFRAKVDESEQTISFELEYSGFVSNVTAAHVRFGQPGLIGGVIFTLCDNADTSKPACAVSDKVEDQLDSSDVAGPAGQGILSGDFAAALRAIRSGATYVDVHTVSYPDGEIRGQIRTSGPPQAKGLAKGKP